VTGLAAACSAGGRSGGVAGGGAEISGAGDGLGAMEALVPGPAPAAGTEAVLAVSEVPARPAVVGDCWAGNSGAVVPVSADAMAGGGGACGWGAGTGTAPGASVGSSAVAPAGTPAEGAVRGGSGPGAQEPSHRGSVSAAVVAASPPALQMPAMSRRVPITVAMPCHCAPQIVQWRESCN
jgi:hypothetical protein